MNAARDTGLAFARVMRQFGYTLDSASAFRGVYGPLDMMTTGLRMGYYCEVTTRYGFGEGIGCHEDVRGKITPRLMAHEFGHRFNVVFVNRLIGRRLPASTLDPYHELNQGISIRVWDASAGKFMQLHVAGTPASGVTVDPDTLVNQKDYECKGSYRRTTLGYIDRNQYNRTCTYGEDFADMFSGWVYGRNSFTNRNTPDVTAVSIQAGQARYDWMETNMAAWLPHFFGAWPPPPPKRVDEPAPVFGGC